jgi:hypothetical protein
VAQRNDRPAGAIRRTEFGLQVRLSPIFASSEMSVLIATSGYLPKIMCTMPAG